MWKGPFLEFEKNESIIQIAIGLVKTTLKRLIFAYGNSNTVWMILPLSKQCVFGTVQLCTAIYCTVHGKFGGEYLAQTCY